MADHNVCLDAAKMALKLIHWLFSLLRVSRKQLFFFQLNPEKKASILGGSRALKSEGFSSTR